MVTEVHEEVGIVSDPALSLARSTGGVQTRTMGKGGINATNACNAAILFDSGLLEKGGGNWMWNP